jgi:hypothetical protein
VLESLMGGAENIEALRQFVDLPEQLAANRFASECLLPPDVVGAANPLDPQVRLAERALFPARPAAPVKVLDFGAGHGRLLDSLAAGSEGDLRTRLDYVGWDVRRNPRCLTAIERVYGAGAGTDRLFADPNDLAAKHLPHTFDAVVMCNVLHEIDPWGWLELFEEHGVIARALSPGGSLVVIEDYLMPKGEYAHPYGFTVLDTAALRALFRADAIQVIPAVGRHAGRIKAHVVPRAALANVSSQTRTEALELAQRNARDKIQSLRRNSDKSFRSGQEHAFWVQQFANTTLALSRCGKA